MMIQGKIRRPLAEMLDHFRFLKSVATGVPRSTMPSPAMLHWRADRASRKRRIAISMSSGRTLPRRTRARFGISTMKVAGTFKSTTRQLP